MNNQAKKWLLTLIIGISTTYSSNLISRSNCNDVCDSSSSSSSGRCHSRSVFIPHSLTTDATLELALNNYEIYSQIRRCPEDRPIVYFQPSYFHLQSTKSNKLASYFQKNGRRCLSIREDGLGDVGSLWLGLISAPGTSFQSTFCIAPKRRVDGGYFNFWFDLNKYICGVWASISFAAANVEHKVCPREFGNDNPGTLVVNGYALDSALAALDNPQWNAGRFTRRKLSNTGIDDVQFKLGYNYFFCNYDHIGVYFVGTAPTGKRRHSRFVFEPRIGTKHGSVGFGLNSDFCIWENCGNVLNWMADFKYRYQLKHKECRTFDLCCAGDWSRYLLVVREADRSNTLPGINFFTRNAEVSPRSTIEFWTAWNYNFCCNYNFEFGYNLWWREREHVRICPANLGVGVFDLAGDCSLNPVSASCANISTSVNGPNRAPSDATFVTETTRDLDPRSGSHPNCLTNKIYAAVSYDFNCMPIMLGFGGSYEFAQKNSALEQWGVWLKASASY